ncbi:MAG: polysaccharide biosynthesis tyrosine autokinase [Phycisphaerae bacterium]|nr:polysaccharide biosynthesis tyrosine autokinase [Phycisphaerae bacterium]MCZ2399710.1 polysaccharide biosynthesis tyrosine autokinase [Phycisphaerae bacterium]NUQ49931.1 polysaccharide biosynthesis tyrosine autokinase [Phycisphaerae bacterium]
MSSVQPTTQMTTAQPYDLNQQAVWYQQSGGAEAPSVGMADVLRILKQRRLMIVVLFFVFYTLVVGATFAIANWAPLWTSEAILELEPPRKNVLDIEPSGDVMPEQMRLALQTESRKLTQPVLLQKVLEQPEIKKTAFYNWYGGNIPKCMTDLRRLLGSTPIPDTYLIRVSLATRDPTETRDIVNAVVDQYLARYVTQAKDELYLRAESLKNTLAERQRKLNEKRDEMYRFREQTAVPGAEEREAMGGLVLGLQAQITQVEVQAAALQQLLESIRDVPVNELPITPEMRILIESDPILRYYRSQVEALDVSIMVNRERLGAKHRDMKTLMLSRQGWYQKEIMKREELITDIRERQIEATRQDLAQTRGVLVRLQDRLQEEQARQRAMSRNVQRYEQMKDDEGVLLKDLEQLQKRASEAEHAVQDKSRERRLSVVQRADRANKPSRPDYFVYLGGGFVVSLVAAVGLAFLREFTDKAIRTPIDVARHGQLSVLGNIPLIDDEEADIDSIELATRKAPHSLVAEAFRQVRTNLLFSGPAEAQRVILITSPGPGDGKTAVAINLAVTLAQSNQRVLLIDCNFRRPAIRDAFPNTRREGLSNILIGQGKLADYVTNSDLANIDVLSSGPMPPSPAELLGSTFMRELLAEARTRYDRVIIDGPPALLISDGIVMSTLVDGVIIVTRAVQNSKGAVKRTREQFERVGARIFGAVLNGVQARAGGYFRRQYREFYEYASDETIPAELPMPPGGNNDPQDAGDGGDRGGR